MSVNSNLSTLMRVIEEAQSKIPEGEYLAAMNALGALHRVIPAGAGVAERAVAPAMAPVRVPVPAPVAVVPQRTPWTIPYNLEECKWFLAQIDAEAAPFVAELKDQDEILKNKVKGSIRKAQKRRNELIHLLNGFRQRRSRYYNGGVV